MSSKLTKALEFANYRTTLNIQHNNLKAKVQTKQCKIKMAKSTSENQIFKVKQAKSNLQNQISQIEFLKSQLQKQVCENQFDKV